jgi:hypothetical protein
MEEVATCKNCSNQSWTIYANRITCSQCGKEYHWTNIATDSEATKAKDLIRLTNDNH